MLDSDPRSPERGQYGFVQALIQRVAYETLSRRDRKAKHLAAAAYLSERLRHRRGRDRGGDRGSPSRRSARRPGGRRRRARSRRERANGSCARRSGQLRSPPPRTRSVPSRPPSSSPTTRWSARACSSAQASSHVRADRLDVGRGTSPRRIRALRGGGRDARPSAGRRRARRERSTCEARRTRGSSSWRRRSRVLAGDEPDADVAALAAQLGTAPLLRR